MSSISSSALSRSMIFIATGLFVLLSMLKYKKVKTVVYLVLYFTLYILHQTSPCLKEISIYRPFFFLLCTYAFLLYIIKLWVCSSMVLSIKQSMSKLFLNLYYLPFLTIKQKEKKQDKQKEERKTTKKKKGEENKDIFIAKYG